MNTSGHVKAVLGLGLPLVGSHVAQMMIGVTDTVMLGWYGVDELAALVLGSHFFFVIFIFGAGFGNAVMPMVAEASAAGEETQVRRVTRMGLWASVFYALLTLPLFLWARDILIAAGQDPDISALAQDYLVIAGFGLFAALLVNVMKSYLSALERTGVVLWAVLAGVVLNIIGNYMLIFGNWGAPELGIRGAAISSVINQILPLILLILYARWKEPAHALLTRIWRADWEAFGQVIRLGIPIGLTILAEVGLFIAASIMIGWVGKIELAAHGIVMQIASLTFMIHLGLSGVATIRAGRALGERNEEKLKAGARVVLVMSLIFAAITIALFLLFPELWIIGFLDPVEPARNQIIALGTVFLAIAAVFQLADGAQAIAIGLLRGIQDTRVPMILAALGYWGIGVPCSYVLSQHLGYGANGVWVGLVIGLVVVAVMLNWRFWSRPAVPQIAESAAAT